jgi:molybdate transport system substrate-binding protein
VTVFAAASLQGALDGCGRNFERAAGGKIVLSYGASSALARQVENGAPADIFISADADWMNYLVQRRLIVAATRVNLLRNHLVLIAPAGSTSRIEIKPGFPLADLVGDGRLSIADPDAVPAGKYAKAALEKLGVWRSVANKLARGDNVRTALNFVARGEAPAGIVYATDAYAEKKVRIVADFPSDSYPPIVYPAARIARGQNPVADAFIAYLQSGDARAIFEKFGFAAAR